MIGRWSEDVVESLAGWTGAQIPFQRFDMVRISAEHAKQEAPGRILMGQDIIDGFLQQKMILLSPEAVSEEVLLEALVQALLFRYVLNRPGLHRNDIETIRIPDWLTVGIAQNLKPELIARNRKYVVQRIQGSRSPLLSEIVSWETLPPGRTDEKPLCGLLLQWWQEECQDKPPWPEVFFSLVEEKQISVDWIAENLLKGSTTEKAESRWAGWIRSLTNGIDEMGALDIRTLVEFKKRLRIDFRSFSLQPPKGLSWQVEPAVMLDWRYEPWVRTIAASMAGEMQLVLATGPKELATVVQSYQEYFEGLTVKKGQRDPSRKALILILGQAEEGLAKLEKEVALRNHMLGALDRSPSLRDSAGSPMPANNLLDLRRRFLDEVEAKTNAPEKK